jgi:hypothetical protein
MIKEIRFSDEFSRALAPPPDFPLPKIISAETSRMMRSAVAVYGVPAQYIE